MGWLKEYIVYALLLAAGAAIWWAVPRFTSTVRVPQDWSDVEGLDHFETKAIDRSVGLAALRRDDPVCYRLGEKEELATNFGWVAGLPGDLILVQGGRLLVDGRPNDRMREQQGLPAMGPIRVPVGHVFVITDGHQHDSFAKGPLPASAIMGRLRSLP